MDWKTKHFKLGRIALCVWVLVIYLKKSFGNETMSMFHAPSSDSLLFQSTRSLLTSSAVLDGSTLASLLNSLNASTLPTLRNTPTLQTLSKALTLANTPSASTEFTHILRKASIVSTASALPNAYLSTASLVLPTPTTLLNPFTSNVSTLNTSIVPQKASSFSSAKFVKLSSSEAVFRGPNKTFVAEIRIMSLNFTSELGNETSSSFYTTALVVTKAIDVVMISETHYIGCEIMSFRDGSVVANFEIKMGPGSSNDPHVALDRLKIAVESGRVGNLTVDSTYFVGWMKKNPSPQEKLLSGQLAGVGIIFFILVILLLVICLGNFADKPLFKETELFSAEMTIRNVGREGDNHDNGENLDDEWKFDPLFAWSHPSSCDSKL